MIGSKSGVFIVTFVQVQNLVEGFPDMTSASHSATDLGRLIRGCTENESLESELEELFDGEMCQKPAVSAGHEVSMSVNCTCNGNSFHLPF